jgi:hypothetical protein
MPSKKERLAARKAKLVLAQKRRDEEQKQGSPPPNMNVADADVAILRTHLLKAERDFKLANKQRSSFIKMQTVGGNCGYDSRYNRFVGANSNHLTATLRKFDRRIKQLKEDRHRLEQKIDPWIVHRLAMRKYLAKEHNRNGSLFWGPMLGDRQGVREALDNDNEPPSNSPIELVQRRMAGLIVSQESPIRCYHLIHGEYGPCDCSRAEGSQVPVLSDRALNLKKQEKLFIDDRSLSFQKLLAMDEATHGPQLNRFCGIGQSVFSSIVNKNA